MVTWHKTFSVYVNRMKRKKKMLSWYICEKQLGLTYDYETMRFSPQELCIIAYHYNKLPIISSVMFNKILIFWSLFLLKKKIRYLLVPLSWYETKAYNFKKYSDFVTAFQISLRSQPLIFLVGSFCLQSNGVWVI